MQLDDNAKRGFLNSLKLPKTMFLDSCMQRSICCLINVNFGHAIFVAQVVFFSAVRDSSVPLPIQPFLLHKRQPQEAKATIRTLAI